MKQLPNFLILFVFVLLFAAPYSVVAQQSGAKATVSIDTARILVGDQVGMKLQFNFPKGARIDWPIKADTVIKGINIVKASGIDSLPSQGEWVTLSQRLTITSFDSGVYTIPSLPFAYMTQSDTAPQFVNSDPILFRVNTIPVDTTKAFKDIRGPLHAKYSFREALPWILIAFVLLVGGVVAYYFWSVKKGKMPFFTPNFKPKMPPHEAALTAIEALRLKKLWQNGQFKAYYTELIDIVRVYMEVAMSINAAEMTSDEIIDSVAKHTLKVDAFEGLKQTLQISDMVKFAKAEPLPTENDRAMNACIDFIQAVRIAQVNASLTAQTEPATIDKTN